MSSSPADVPSSRCASLTLAFPFMPKPKPESEHKRPGAKPGKSILRDLDLRRVRALAIINRKIVGAMSSKSIAAEFNLSSNTVENEIDWAKRQGLVASYEDQLLNELVPAAIAAFKVALANNDAQVALEVLKGAGLLRKQNANPIATPPPSVQEETLEIYMKRRSVSGGTPNSGLFTSKRNHVAELNPAPASTASDRTLRLHAGGVSANPDLSPPSPAPSVGAHRDEGDPPIIVGELADADDPQGPTS
jgi:hypothetical protein